MHRPSTWEIVTMAEKWSVVEVKTGGSWSSNLQPKRHICLFHESKLEQQGSSLSGSPNNLLTFKAVGEPDLDPPGFPKNKSASQPQKVNNIQLRKNHSIKKVILSSITFNIVSNIHFMSEICFHWFLEGFQQRCNWSKQTNFTAWRYL